MSLTSYRAAPPRDKPLHCLDLGKPGTRAGSRGSRAGHPCQLPEKASLRALPRGCGGYVSIRTCFGKGFGRSFFDFVTGKMSQNGAKITTLARSSAKDEALATNFGGTRRGENAIGGKQQGPAPDKPSAQCTERYIPCHAR